MILSEYYCKALTCSCSCCR